MKTSLANRAFRMSKMLRRTVLAAACLTAVYSAGLAAEPSELNKSVATQNYNLSRENLALKGYDLIAYFDETTPLKGKQEISTVHRGVTYYFATEANRKMFTASPEKYLPAFGGWCATAMAKGEKVQIDPANFKITNGRLFLFYNGLFGNALKDWNKDELALTAKADAHWKTISGE